MAETLARSFGVKVYTVAHDERGRNAFLFLQRINGRWDMPGGRLEEGDKSPWQGLGREVLQETGYTLINEGPDQPFAFAVQDVPPPPETRRLVRVTYVGRLTVPGLVVPVLNPGEHIDAEWMSREVALEKLGPELDPVTAASLGSKSMALIDSALAPGIPLEAAHRVWQASQ